MKPQHQAFVKAYLGPAQGNATKAAIAAGYSEASAHVTGCRLLKTASVQAAIERASQKADVSAADAWRNVRAIADQRPEKVSASDILKANELILKGTGALRDKDQSTGITVNIGFLQQPAPTVEVVQVMGQHARLGQPEDSEP